MAENDLPTPDSPAPVLPPARPRGLPAWVEQRAPLIAYLLVVLAVLVVVNVLASRHDKSWDLTKNRTYSLSPESVQIVKGLPGPLHLLYFGRSSDFGSAKDFLGRYQRESNKVDVQFIDPDRHPDQAKAYGIQTYGTIVVESNGRKELVNNLAEQDLTNAIVRTLKGARQTIYFTEGEGEHDPDDASGRNGYGELKDALTAENFTVQKLVLAQTPAVPDDCAVLVIAGPTHPMLQPEVDAISKYLDGGGRVFFLPTIETAGPLVDYFTRSLNVKLTPDVVIDTSGIGRLFGASELMPIVAQYDNHPITEKMSEVATLFPYARTVEPGGNASARATVVPLLETSSNSQATTNFKGGQVEPGPGDKKGPLTLGVAGTMATVSNGGAHPGDSAEARFVVIGSPDFADNQILGFQGNRDLFINAVDWLGHQENFITIRPQPPQSSPINISENQMRLVFFSFVVGLPLLIVLFAVAMWWRRRTA